MTLDHTLTQDDVVRIQQLRASKIAPLAIAEQLGTSRRTVYRVLAGWQPKRVTAPTGTRHVAAMAQLPEGAHVRKHELGHCTCKTHSAEPWNRPEHWTADEVGYLEDHFGLSSDAHIARHLGRTEVGVRLKAKRLGLRKKDAGYTSRALAQVFGVDETVVSKTWIRRHQLLSSRRSFRVGPNKVHLVMDADIERFITEHGEWIDIDRMPDSVWRDLALRGGRWYALPTVQQLTGRNAHILSKECLDGRWPARRRGSYWMIHESSIPAIKATAGHNGRLASMANRERRLEHRRNVRKGVEQPRPHPLLGRGRPEARHWRRVECPEHDDEACATCQGKGFVLRNRNEIRLLPEAWAA